MPHCCAFGCNFTSKKNKNTSVTLHSFPKEPKLRKTWMNAVHRATLPKDPRLCSQHFGPDTFDDSIRLQQNLVGHCRWKRKLKQNAIPSIFAHKPVKKPRLASEQRAARRQRQQTIEEALASVCTVKSQTKRMTAMSKYMYQNQYHAK
ncbi:hypothetical protein OS493_036628 [Desmophyllum pertusum]|uniref:THAP-type domain-containing protein n=1 Tax=Desmophyllum pertusum TaxID=174260 RepID=A0A9X0CWN7_9CNID|nr:hypothetical protein OS493_036628 [Desmophyllum pertusum]